MIQNSISNSQADETARFLWEFENKNPDDPLTWNSKPRAEMQMKELVGTGMVEAYNHQTLWSNRQSKKIYDAFVDIWGSQNAKNLKDLKSELNAAIEGGDTAAEKRLTKAVDKLQSKLQKKATHRFDYVLNNPVSLYNAEEMNNIRAEESKDLRARKVC